MKSLIKLATALAVATAALATPAFAEKPAELAPAELAALQARPYNVPADTAFKSVLTVLQNLGYMDIQANKDAGTISGTTESKGKIIYNILWGFGKKKLTQKASLLVEDNGPAASIVRLNLVVAQTKARGIFGTSFSDGQMVKVADPYQQFFTALDTEVKDRTLRDVPQPSPAPAAPSAVQAVEAPAANPQQ
jgi:hypothetical protein